MKTIILFIVGLLLISASCKKKKKCSRSYDLEHPVSVYPIKESYNVGDTIWFEMSFADVFNAEITNNFTGKIFYENIQLKNFDFRRNFFRIFKLNIDTIPAFSQEYKWNAFSSMPILGTVVQEYPEGIEYNLLYFNNQYRLKIGVICNEVGNYLFSPLYRKPYPNSSYGANQQDLTPECEQEIIIGIRTPINKQTDGTHLTNYHLFEQFMNPALENNLGRIKNECFTFVVN